ncbi:MAG: DUF1847 domain-containing protein [Desulfatiglandales bacterium]
MVGRTPKGFLGIQEDQKGSTGEFESIWSTITQVKFLNKDETEFTMVFGLCVGHDSLFMRYSNALDTRPLKNLAILIILKKTMDFFEVTGGLRPPFFL